MKVGDARVSTAAQNEESPIEMLNSAGVEKIYTDKQSGKTANRQELKAMLAFVRQGDTVIAESISRIARNTKDLLSIVEELSQKQVEFISLKENIDTTTPTGRFMLTVFAACAEMEREFIAERTREGIAIAKAAGKMNGKQPMKIDKVRFAAVAARWRAGQITAVAAMNELGLKSNTFYRRIKEWDL